VTFKQAMAIYVTDMRAEGRITSDRSEATYWRTLELHAEDIGNRDPRTTGREDIKRTLRRWSNPSTQRTRRAVLVSFYDWAMEEGYRKDNPARQTRRPRAKPADVFRLTRQEAQAMLATANTGRVKERRAVHIGLLAGLRRQELIGLQGLHFERDGWIWVSGEIAKGGRERWVPVLPDLEPVVNDIRSTVARAHFVLPAQKQTAGGFGANYVDVPEKPMGAVTLYRMVGQVGARAGVSGGVTVHALRRAFAEHVARESGLRVAQALLGHADVGTTRGYTDAPTLDELRDAVRGTSFTDRPAEGLPPSEPAGKRSSGDGGNRTREKGAPFDGPAGIER